MLGLILIAGIMLSTAGLLIPNPINSCANGSGIPNLRQMPWSRMHKDSWELVLELFPNKW